MKLVLAVTTFDRLEYLKIAIESWESTCNRTHDWLLLAADDGSQKDVQDYLDKRGFHVLRNSHRGIHHRVNSIFKYLDDVDFDYAFRIDDDLMFKKRGWDDAYIDAIRASGYDHLVFHDPEWPRIKRHRDPVEHGSLECRSYWDDIQGAFWTFTKRLFSAVGYFDVSRFGPCGFGHRDYTFRCCKAGFNFLQPGDSPFDCIYDMKGSLDYLELIKDDYQPADPDFFHTWNNLELRKRKLRHLFDDRVYVSCREL